jgi:hypothetical protein
LGDCPESGRARRQWHQAAERIEEYRERYGVADDKEALGPEQGDFEQRHDRREAQAAIDKVVERDRGREQSLERERAWERSR